MSRLPGPQRLTLLSPQRPSLAVINPFVLYFPFPISLSSPLSQWPLPQRLCLSLPSARAQPSPLRSRTHPLNQNPPRDPYPNAPVPFPRRSPSAPSHPSPRPSRLRPQPTVTERRRRARSSSSHQRATRAAPSCSISPRRSSAGRTEGSPLRARARVIPCASRVRVITNACAATPIHHDDSSLTVRLPLPPPLCYVPLYITSRLSPLFSTPVSLPARCPASDAKSP